MHFNLPNILHGNQSVHDDIKEVCSVNMDAWY
jgi:hypothetical protein